MDNQRGAQRRAGFVILFPASPSRIIVLLEALVQERQRFRVNFFRSKTAFVAHFLSGLHECFQLPLLLTHSLTILGTAGI